MNKEKQQTLVERYEAVKKTLDTGWKGLITDVTEKTNTEYFRKEGIYGEKNGISVSVKCNSPDGETFDNWFSEPTDARGITKSNLFAFEKRYGSLPVKGIEVDVVLDENGFFKIVI